LKELLKFRKTGEGTEGTFTSASGKKARFQTVAAKGRAGMYTTKLEPNKPWGGWKAMGWVDRPCER
jgi:hypothetical protein